MAETQQAGGAPASDGSAVTLCTNNCGYFGSPATDNLCSKCYNDKQQQMGVAAFDGAAPSPSPSVDDVVSGFALLGLKELKGQPAVGREKGVVPTTATKSRCEACRKKVGLLGFACRCGRTYCGAHRHADAHACGFDYKASGREQIARQNPLVVASKLDKI